MNIPRTQIKALALLFVFVIAFSFSEYRTVVADGFSGQQGASVFDSLSTFLGIQTNNTNSNTNADGDYVDNADAYFSNISDDPFNAASNQTNINTPSANTGVQTTQVNQVGTGPLATRGVTLICIPPVIGVSEDTILMWACRDSAHITTSENFDSAGETIGTIRVQPTEDTTYTIECVNDTDDIENTKASCIVNVAEPILTFSADSTSVDRGESVVLTWETTDVNSCLLTSDTHIGFTRRGTEGQVKTPAVLRDTIFRLTCESQSGLLEEKELEINAK